MTCLLLLAILADPPMVVWTAQPGQSFVDVENLGDVNGDGTSYIREYSPAELIKMTVHGVVDVGGDGLYELILSSQGTESSSFAVYQLRPDGLAPFAHEWEGGL